MTVTYWWFRKICTGINAVAFNQDLSTWDVSSITKDMFTHSQGGISSKVHKTTKNRSMVRLGTRGRICFVRVCLCVWSQIPQLPSAPAPSPAILSLPKLGNPMPYPKPHRLLPVLAKIKAESKADLKAAVDSQCILLSPIGDCSVDTHRAIGG